MSTSTENQFKSRRRLLVILAVLLIIAAAVTAAIALVSSESSAPSSSPTEAPADTGDEEDVSEEPLDSIAAPSTAPLSDDEQIEVERATSAVNAVITATDEIAQRGDGSAVGIEAVTTGWVLGELQAKAREQYDLGYRQTGTALIIDVTATSVDLTAEPASITLKVCVDVSDIDVLDAAGSSLKDSLYNPGHPVAHLYGAIFEDSTWKISTHDIPAEQDCPAA